MRHQPAIGDAYTLKIEKFDLEFSQYVDNEYTQIQSKINEIISLFNNLKFTVTLREAEQLSLFSKFFDKRVCVVCKGLGYKMARNPDKQEELIKDESKPSKTSFGKGKTRWLTFRRISN